jgi:hypothetical protein
MPELDLPADYTPPAILAGDQEDPMADAFTDPPRPLTPNPSRGDRATQLDPEGTATERIDQALEHLAGLYEWAEANDPQPPWYRRRARRAWRAKWGITP